MKRNWWKEAVVYQIYPRSFMDANGDGVGDFAGILTKVDYLADLGIDVVWLSPIYRSPCVDNGYDISDYRAVLDEFGTLAELDMLIARLHEKGIKLVMDLVVNHTSSAHPWFVEARKSRDNPYHDYYIWKDGDKDTLPNNWESHFSGTVWTWDDHLQQFYLHIFAPEQPDLNWENPKVRAEVADICKFWLERGVDGFRMDVINLISKTPGLPSVSGHKELVRGHEFYMNGPRVHEYLRELRKDAYDGLDIMTVGETPNVTPDIALDYVGEGRGELDMVFQFEHMLVDSSDGFKWNLIPWTLPKLKGVIAKWQRALYGKGWNSLYLTNHDQPRSVSRFGNDGQYRALSAKMLATMLHTLQGTPYVYQGEELGMTNVKFATIEEYEDIQTVNYYRGQVDTGADPAAVLAKVHYRSRDNARTPMQWDSTPHGGFTAGTPWLAVNPNYTTINAAAQVGDPESIHSYYRQLIALRKNSPIVVYGSFTELLEESEKVFAYRRDWESETLVVLLNFMGDTVSVSLPELPGMEGGRLYIANYPDPKPDTWMALRPYEAVAVLLRR